VYSWDALEELCIKPKNWKDLLTEEPFTRKDIIHLQVRGTVCYFEV
jgi:peptidyl-prolyl cis-trans isomerase-like protein 2